MGTAAPAVHHQNSRGRIWSVGLHVAPGQRFGTGPRIETTSSKGGGGIAAGPRGTRNARRSNTGIARWAAPTASGRPRRALRSITRGRSSVGGKGLTSYPRALHHPFTARDHPCESGTRAKEADMSCGHEHCSCSEQDHARGPAAHSHGDAGSRHGHGCCGGDHALSMAAEAQGPSEKPKGGPSDGLVER